MSNFSEQLNVSSSHLSLGALRSAIGKSLVPKLARLILEKRTHAAHPMLEASEGVRWGELVISSLFTIGVAPPECSIAP